MSRVRNFVSVLVLAIAIAVVGVAAGCQSAPQVAPQRGPDSGAQTSPISPSAPVDQHGVLIVSPTVVMAGPSSADGKLPTVTITVGPAANGDVKGLGKQEGGAQSSANTLTQQNSPTQDVSVSPEAIAKAAGELLATVAPGSEAANLATAALDATRAGDAAKAKDLLGKAKVAAQKGTAEPSKRESPLTTEPAPPAK
ncbi:MAG: hypothetical protein K8T90_19305 [Planctomycetes bacterium]|nr:hypothetical protein [Planctomycetota bacterium]